MRKNNRGEALKALLSRNIKLFRVHSGLSQADLAEKTGISVPYLGAVERGDKWPGPAVLAEIARSLGVEPHDLLKPEGASSRDVRKVMDRLAKEITTLASQSVKMLNNIAKESGSREKA